MLLRTTATDSLERWIASTASATARKRSKTSSPPSPTTALVRGFGSSVASTAHYTEAYSWNPTAMRTMVADSFKTEKDEYE
jgi:hypothetical protein